jgi:prevent-host-death family protein
MAKELTSREARQQFADVLGRARYTKEPTIVTNNGQQVAAVISIEDFKLLQAFTQEKRRADFQAALGEANEQYGPMLERLAK